MSFHLCKVLLHLGVITYKRFRKKLFNWCEENPRLMPWVNEQDIYKIWISEIILQQTRSEQAQPYYEKIIKKYPNVQALASATQNELFKVWEGLGYYRRAVNLHITAQYIVSNLNGNFPKSYDQILGLKGVGPYTAAAIASFGYNLPYAVLDGNVIRVLSRIFGIEQDPKTTNGKRNLQEYADKCLDKLNPSKYNQAIMNFGAIWCTPKTPKCGFCPFYETCIAFQENLITLLPYKAKKAKLKKRFFHYLIPVFNNSETPIRQRKEKDIWNGLYEFILLETKSPKVLSKDRIIKHTNLQQIPITSVNGIEVYETNQKLTHQSIHVKFYLYKVDKQLKIKKTDQFIVLNSENLMNFAFPRVIRVFLNQIANKTSLNA